MKGQRRIRNIGWVLNVMNDRDFSWEYAVLYRKKSVDIFLGHLILFRKIERETEMVGDVIVAKTICWENNNSCYACWLEPTAETSNTSRNETKKFSSDNQSHVTWVVKEINPVQQGFRTKQHIFLNKIFSKMSWWKQFFVWCMEV